MIERGNSGREKERERGERERERKGEKRLEREVTWLTQERRRASEKQTDHSNVG